MNEIVLEIPTAMLWLFLAVLAVSTVQNAVKAYLEWQLFKAQFAGARLKANAMAEGRKDDQRQNTNRSGRKKYGH